MKLKNMLNKRKFDLVINGSNEGKGVKEILDSGHPHSKILLLPNDPNKIPQLRSKMLNLGICPIAISDQKYYFENNFELKQDVKTHEFSKTKNFNRSVSLKDFAEFIALDSYANRIVYIKNNKFVEEIKVKSITDESMTEAITILSDNHKFEYCTIYEF